MKRLAFHHIEATLNCVSGLHVGGSQDDLEIGGTDSPVIKHPTTLQPYLPGSSLKGKMRSELEKQLGKLGGREGTEPCGCLEPNCPVCRVFGTHKSPRDQADKQRRLNLGPTRLIVRDAQISTAGMDLELKTENVINRKTGAAEHPRTLERVPAGSEFTVQWSLQVYDSDANFEYANKKGAEALLAVVRTSLELVEKTGLGSGTSRGSGQIKFQNWKLDGQDWK